MRNSNKGGLITFDTQVCAFPESSDRLSSIGAKDITKRVKINTNKKIFSEDEKTYVYEYTNIKNVRVTRDKIHIGSSFSIDHNDVINAEYIQDRRVDDGTSWRNDNIKYLRLVIDENSTDMEEHSQRESLYYIYFLARSNDFEHKTNATWKHVRVRDDISASAQDLKRTVRKINKNSTDHENELTVVSDWIMKPPKLRIEGVDKGSSITGGTISGNTQSTGSSKGIQVGPFTKGKSTSQGSFEGKINTTTSDNTFTSEIKLFIVGKNGIYIKSDPNINVNYSEINRIARADDGIFIEIGQQTYSVEPTYNNVSFNDLNGSFSTVRSKIKSSSNAEENFTSESKPTEQINELKKLYDKGAITEEEFNNKKKELLDEI